MAPKRLTLLCCQCDATKVRDEFSVRQRSRRSPVCKTCAAHNVANNVPQQPRAMLICSRCQNTFPRLDFAIRQRKRKAPVCQTCTSDQRQAPTLLCTQCGDDTPREGFSPSQRKKGNRVCVACVEILAGATPTSMMFETFRLWGVAQEHGPILRWDSSRNELGRRTRQEPLQKPIVGVVPQHRKEFLRGVSLHAGRRGHE